MVSNNYCIFSHARLYGVIFSDQGEYNNLKNGEGMSYQSISCSFNLSHIDGN